MLGQKDFREETRQWELDDKCSMLEDWQGGQRRVSYPWVLEHIQAFEEGRERRECSGG